MTLPSGEEVWKTELAAAYPEGLCVSIARAVVARPAPSLSISTEVGQPHQGAEPIKKHTRQLAADASIGGLRDAAASLHHVPGWGTLGAQLRGFIDGAIADLDVDSILATLGQEDTPGVLLLAGLHVRHLMAAWMFPGGHPHLLQAEGLQATLFAELVRRSGDPEVFGPQWLAHGAPIGIHNVIPSCGIFPPDEGDPVADGAWEFEAVRSDFKNYTSLYDNQALALAELRREEALGFLELSSLADLTAKHGPLHPARFAGASRPPPASASPWSSTHLHWVGVPFCM